MKVVHFCAGLEAWNGMANTARQFVAEENAQGHDSQLTNRIDQIAAGTDVVEIHGAWLPVVHRAARRAKAVGATLIVRPAGSYDPVRRHFHAWKKRLMAPWEHEMLRLADTVQATCPQEAEWIRAYHPGVSVELTDLKRFFKIPDEVVSPYHRERALSVRRPLRVLYLGRQHPLKGVAYLRQAVAELNMDSVSGRNGGSEAREFATLCEVSDTYGEALEKIWEWSDVLCLPTLSENFGRVVAESLEHGRPVITTDGAPAWYDLKPTQGYYLKGYRDGSDVERVRLLKDALIAISPW